MKPNNRDENEFNKRGLKVIVKNNDFGKAMKAFKKLIAQEGVLKELREREYYVSKGEKRRRAKAEAAARYRKQANKDDYEDSGVPTT